MNVERDRGDGSRSRQNPNPDPEAERQRLIAAYEAEFNNPYQAAELGYIDDVIDPQDTRPLIIRALEMLKNKSDQSPPKKHGNIPL